MPEVQRIVVRMDALQYDGSNGQDIADFVNDYFQQTLFTVGSEAGGTLELVSHSGLYGNATMDTNDYMVIPDAAPCTPSQYAYRYNVLPVA